MENQTGTLKTISRTENVEKLFGNLAKSQLQLGALVKDATNPYFKSNYATLKAVIETYREPFANNGLSVSQFIDGEQLVSILAHESGQHISSCSPIRCKDRTDPQKEGSGITYARRYALMAIAGLAPEDDDGNSASRPQGKGGGGLYTEAVNKIMDANAFKHLENLWKKHSTQWNEKLNEIEFGNLMRIKDYRKIEFDTRSFHDEMKDAKAFDDKTSKEKAEKLVNDVKETFKVSEKNVTRTQT